MDGLRTSTRLLSGTRLPTRYANKTVRGLSVCTQCRALRGQTQLSRRTAALPSRSRECASQLRYQTTAAQVARGGLQEPALEPESEPVRQSEKTKWRSFNKGYISIGPPLVNTTPGAFHPVFLRDACPCPRCIDPSSTQKNFQTTDIPESIQATSVELQENGDVAITWANDIPGFGPDHVSTYPAKFFKLVDTRYNRLRDVSEDHKPRIWNRNRLAEELQYINYDDYMTDDKDLFRALILLNAHGVLILRGVPKSEESVAKIAGRIGTIRDTFYGRTWDVKSVPKARNVAYTQQYLGLHMDLLYMTNPPGIQLLHCLDNTCEGGASLFSDSFQAVRGLEQDDVDTLTTLNLAYHYRNAGEHYYYERPVIELDETHTILTPTAKSKSIKFVNYSPPFQAVIPIIKQSQRFLFPQLDKALRNFAKTVEAPENLYEYRLQEGECVIFNNRRVLHGRREFEAETGQRWLKGAYVDTDVFNSKWRVLNERFRTEKLGSRTGADAKPVNAVAGDNGVTQDKRLDHEDAKYVNPDERRRIQDSRVIRRAREIEEGLFEK